MQRSYLVLFLMFFSATTLFAQFTEVVFDDNVKSEGAFYTKDNTLYTDRIVVKFKNAILNLNENNKQANRQAIANTHNNVNSLLADLASQYGEMDIIKKIPSADPNDLQRANKRTGEIVTITDMSQLYTIKFPSPVPLESTVKSFSDLLEVEFAHQPVSYSLHIEPNDTKYQNNEQWYLDAISADGAWDITHGSSSIYIAIIDDGSDDTHEDLSSKIARFDGVTGYHGVMVSGVAGATTNNNVGIASLGWETKLHTYGTDFIDDIYLAVTKGADIMNMSWGTIKAVTEQDIIETMPDCSQPSKWDGAYIPWDYPEVRQAIEDAAAQGVLLIASAGNSAGNYGYGPDEEDCNPWTIPFLTYPAAYSDVIAVSATGMANGTEQFVDIFNHGNFIDFSAPGWDILTTSNKVGSGGYERPSGTSFSSPLTCALASLIMAKDPNEDVFEIIKFSADKIDATNYPYDGNGWNQYLGYGRINAEAALLAVFPEVPANLYLTGSVGQHPILHWNANSEADLDGYNIYQKIGSGSITLLTSVGAGATTFQDNGVTISNGKFDPVIKYWVSAFDLANNESAKSNTATTKGGLNKVADNPEASETALPTEFKLYPAFPNPFNPTTTISYDLVEAGSIKLSIYNQLGILVWVTTENYQQAGRYRKEWNGISSNNKKVASGVYYVVVSVANQTFKQKVVLLK